MEFEMKETPRLRIAADGKKAKGNRAETGGWEFP